MDNTALSETSPISSRQPFIDRLSILTPVIIIFAIVFTLSAIKNIYDTSAHAKSLGYSAIATLEDYLDNTASELSELNRHISKTCNVEDTQRLRQYVFQSPKAKEVSLFDAKGQVYCSSNEGKTSFDVGEAALKQIKKTQTLTTIVLSESRSHDTAIFIYSANKDLSGINALLPPNLFLELITPQFELQHYDYQVNILQHSLEHKSGSENQAYRSYDFKSERYPITLTINLTPQSYFTHYGQHIWRVILLASAIAVLYQAIRNYKLTRNSLAFSLKEAINNQELVLNFQPIVDIHQPKIVGSEALIRWNNPDHGSISPTIFIPLAERIQVIEQITHQVFQLVTDFVNLNPHLVQSQYISINVSRTLITKSKFVEFLERYAKRHPDILPLLLLEITEDNDFSPKELETVRTNLGHLKQLGFKIAMDDFGTGYSGLNFIHQHAFDIIKIDQVFIKGLSQNSAIDSVITSMIKLAKQLKMRVIAEGVETHEQVEQLRGLGVRYIQGFYYSEPLPAEDYILKLTAQMEGY
ncbi:EAL domain-containing protein [Vibrio diazotrophicus]|uniref:EAL domain-containing protein n=1 Tax=Vibrio diazotrophicus TaxID=685 RepID=UPI00142D3E02|nr:EAL domain-containing protein [Vibrio diazotrophicus]NIY93906.1 EAL domain-containing protein [Vibrio diazotrophicus]